MKVNKLGDDFDKNRLLSYLRKQLPYHIDELIPFRKNVYYVKTPKMNFVLKGYSSHQRLKLQESFAKSVRKEGFLNTYQYIDINNDEPLFFEKEYYGCWEFIEHSAQSFSYQRKKDRNDGLRILKAFHQTTKRLVSRYETLLPKYDLIEKWQERLERFTRNIPVIQFFISKEMINELLSWANWSLAGMKQERDFFEKKPFVILHGDVAHHNFIRGSNNKLYLIDFDLITTGNESIDYLQYANRILPFLNWSFKELSNYKLINAYLNKKAFLYALAYPTDILREWNRIIKEKNYHHPNKIRTILQLTNDQFHLRRHFVNEIQQKVK